MDDLSSEIVQMGFWLHDVSLDAASGRFGSAMKGQCPNRDASALTYAAQIARDQGRQSYRAYQESFATDRDLARTRMAEHEFWTDVERFLVSMGGQPPSDPEDAQQAPQAPQASDEQPRRRRWRLR